MRHLLFGTLAVLVFTPAAFGHGSCYRGPSSEAPPGARDPVPPLPTFHASSPDTWEWWWSLNKEEFLYPDASRSRGSRGEPPREDRRLVEDAIFCAFEKALRDEMTCPARSRVALAAGAVAASRGGAPASLVERLRELSLDRKQQAVVQACTAIALGMAGQMDRAVVSGLSRTVLDGDARTSVRGAAALAIGLLRVRAWNGDSVHRLAWSTLDIAAKADSADLRACALIAAGLDGSPERLPAVLGALACPDRAAGIPGPPPAPSEHSDKSLSLVVTGLGKFADLSLPPRSPEVFTTLRRIASGSSEHSRRAAVAALGRWGSIGGLDEKLTLKAVTCLMKAAQGDDPLAARLALLSLAQIGRVTQHDRVLEHLTAQLTRAFDDSKGDAVPYRALALGILGRSRMLSVPDRKRISKRLRSELLSLRLAVAACGAPPGASAATQPMAPPPGTVTPVPAAPSSPDAPQVCMPTRNRTGDSAPPPVPQKWIDKVAPGAYALALGLIGDEAAVSLLAAIVEDEGAHPRLRGHAAVALGMLGSTPCMDQVRKVVLNTKDANLLVLASLGAGLAGDAELLPALLARAGDGTLTNRERTVAIRAAGKLGARSAIPQLLKLVGDESATDVVRSTAAIAIADLYDRDGALVLTRLTRDLSAYAKNDTFDLILSVF